MVKLCTFCGAIIGATIAIAMGIPSWIWDGDGDPPRHFGSYCDWSAYNATGCKVNVTETVIVVTSFSVASGAIVAGIAFFITWISTPPTSGSSTTTTSVRPQHASTEPTQHNP